MIETMTRLFLYQGEKSPKFWEVTTNGYTVTVRSGKIGALGQSRTKELPDERTAAKHVAKLVAEKTGKGYVESSASAAASVTDTSVEDLVTEPAAAPRQNVTTKRKAVPKNPAKDLEGSPESLLALLNKDDATNRLLAKHPNASADLLEKLSHSSDQATRKSVCLNPKAGKDVLLRLAPQFPGDFFRNPVFDWLLLEDPDLLFKLGQGVLKNILKQPDCPLSFLRWAASNGTEQEQLAVAMNPNAAAELIEILATKPGTVADAAQKCLLPDIAEHVNLNQIFKAEVNRALVEMDEKQYHLLWQYELIDISERLNYKRRATRAALLALIDKKMLDGDLVNSFSSGKARGLRLIGLAHRKAAPDILAKRSKSIDWVERMAIARNPSSPINVIAILKSDPHSLVARQAAVTERVKDRAQARQNKTLATTVGPINLQPIVNTIVQRLRESCVPWQLVGTHWWGRLSVFSRVGRDNPLEETAESLFLLNSPLTPDLVAKSPEVWVRSIAARSLAVDPELLDALSNDADWQVKIEAANNPKNKNSIPVLENLAKNESNWVVRWYVARSPQVSSSLLEILAKDESVMVMKGVAENHRTPTQLLETLAKDERVRGEVAQNPTINLALLESLSKDSSNVVRGCAAENSLTPLSILKTLSKEKDIFVRKGVANNQNCDLQLLEMLAQDKNEKVRRAVAKNPKTSSNLLEILAKDKKEGVRSGVAENPKTPLPILKVLATDEKETVKISVLLNPVTPFDLMMCMSEGRINKEEYVDLHCDTNQILRQESYCRSYAVMRQQVLMWRTAEDPNTSQDHLLELSKDGLWSMRLAALNNPSMPTSARNDGHKKLWSDVAAAVLATDTQLVPNKFSLQEIPAALQSMGLMPDPSDKKAIAAAAKSEDFLERVGAILTPGIQPSLLRMLLDDEAETVRQIAASQLRELEASRVAP